MDKYSLISAYLFSFLTMVSCGKGSDGKDATQQQEEEKSIFGKCTSTDRTLSYDSTGGQYNVAHDVTFKESTGEVCICRQVVSGNESSGNIDLFSCVYAGGGPGDPVCADDLRLHTYSKAGGAL